MTIYIPIETYSREFDSKLLAAFQLARNGAQVVIGAKNSINNFAKLNSEQNDIYITKDFSKLSLPIVTELYRKKVTIIAMDEEGLIWNTPEDYLEKRVSNEL